MIKRKTIQKIVFCLAVFLACQNNSFARLIEPEPKPNEFKNKILKINNTKHVEDICRKFFIKYIITFKR